ncbi:hypothetical protein KAT63_04015 [Candidatus Parcubacteria bacterium]|nr:hypothetical protein [Candidatus Parcubacteria bacterium]
MKFKKILTIGIKDSSLDEEYWKMIDELSEKRVSISADSNEINDQLKDTDCLLINPFVFKVKKELIDLAPELKYINVLATAYGKVDCEYATMKNIVVCNVPDYSTEAVAEFVFGALLEHLRELEKAKERTGNGDYSEYTVFDTIEIKGKKFGIIGLGNIGRRIAELASAFGADVSYWSKNRKMDQEAKGIKYADVETILQECDFISINLTLTKETEHFLNEKHIARIKTGAVIINMAPNELVDLDAFEKRLNNRDITYIMDHPDELTKDQISKLAKHENCIIYPPIGYITKEATINKQEIFVGNIRNFLEGKITNKVN